MQAAHSASARAFLAAFSWPIHIFGGNLRIQDVQQVETRKGFQTLARLVDDLAENGFRTIEIPAHTGILRALAREEHGDARVGTRTWRETWLRSRISFGLRSSAIACSRLSADKCQAMAEGAPSDGKGVGGVGQRKCCRFRRFHVLRKAQTLRVERC